MAVPLFSPTDPNQKYTDPDTGITYSFDSGNSSWNPISSGSKQGPYTASPINADFKPITVSTGGAQDSGGGSGGLTADHLRGIGFTDDNVIRGILNSPGEVERYIRELGIGGDPDAERRRIEEEQNRIRSGINDAYGGIFSELDRQAGLLPGQEAGFDEEISNLANLQRGDVERGQERQLASLEATKDEERATTKSALKDLEQDVRNQLSSFGNYIGALGAGNSSAATQIASVIGREATKARGKVQQGLQTALNKLDLKGQEIQSLAQDQLSQVEQWKGSKLLEIKQYFDGQLQSLNNARLNATGQKAAAIANMIVNTEQQFYARLQELDNNVIQFKSAIGQWMIQRAGDLEDYKTKLALTASYKKGEDTGPGIEEAAGIVNTLYNAGAPFGAALTAGQSVDPSLLSGYSFTSDQLNRNKTSSLFDLYNQLGINPATLESTQPQSNSLEIFGIPILNY